MIKKWMQRYPSTTVRRTEKGDRTYAFKFYGEASKLLYQLKNLMKFRNLGQLGMTRRFTNGTIITAKSHFGYDSVEVDVTEARVVVFVCPSVWTDREQNLYAGHFSDLGGGMVLGGGGEIFRSGDYGITWVNYGTQYDQGIAGFAYLDNGIVVAATNGANDEYPWMTSGKILRSTNYGVTWTDLGPLFWGGTTSSIVNLGSGVVLAGGHCLVGEEWDEESKILKSIDYGVTWTELITWPWIEGIPVFLPEAMVSLGGGIIVVGGSSTTGCKIMRSTNYGSSWTESESLFVSGWVHCFVNFGGGVVLGATRDPERIVQSTDYGITWVVGSTYSVNCFAYLGSGIVLAGINSMVLKSTDYGITWIDSETGFGALSLIYLGVPDKCPIILAGTPTSRIFRFY